ncbi:MAG: hypothetical protein ACT4PS_01295 [Betaproteobacteria bacterium]
MSAFLLRPQGRPGVLAALVFAVSILLHLEAGAAAALAVNDTASPIVELGCCNAFREFGCGDVRMSETPDRCARHCIEGNRSPQRHVALSPSNMLLSVAGIVSSKALYPPQRPDLDEAPRAISSTPLIYHLQRLLN